MFRNLSAAALGVSGHQSEIIELALTYGFQGLDIDISEFATRIKLKGADYARRLLQSARLRPGAFELPLELDCDDATFAKRIQRLTEYAQVAGEVGCTRAVTAISPASDSRPYHENFEFHRQRLAEVCRALQAGGVRLGVSFQGAEQLRKGRSFQFIHDLDALTLLVSMVGVPNIGLSIDVWELFVGGASVDTIRKLPAAQIVAVQVANLPAGVATAEVDENSRLLPSAEGAIDVSAVLLALSGIGYDGPVTPKPSRSLFRNLRRDAIVKEAGDSLMRAWKAAGLGADGRPVAPARG
jgi:sugar phosphate isomerase/epimerase